MEEVNAVSLAVWRCVDACCLLLELLIRTLSWLLHFLSGVGVSLHNALVVPSGSTLVFSFLTASEAVSSAACGALHAAEGWLRTLGGVFESFKMVGHLSCHVAWRVKDALHRGLMSCSCVLRQVCEGLCIALSLVLYVVNTAVNVVLIGVQNCASVCGGVWEVVADPVHTVLDLALTLLTFLYSCLVGASVLLWTPCQLVLDLLGGLGRFFFTVFTLDSHGLLMVVVVVSVGFLFLNRRLPVLTRWLSLQVVDAPPGAGAQAEPEPAAANQEVQSRTAQEASAARLTNSDALIAEADLQPATEPGQPDSVQLQAQRDQQLSGHRAASAPQSDPTDGELLSRLKEQEERKKCVICQDLSKTVLLLPCRHLCLCRRCADILTRCRHAQQRCCPLCRRPITQTMDVFL